MTTSHDIKIIFLSGPPRSGKDTVAQVIAQQSPRNVRICSFADEVKIRAHAIYHLQDTKTKGPIHPHALEEHKDQPLDLLMGRSPREIYIAFSEEYMKPLHGKDVFGQLLLDRIKNQIANEQDGNRTEVICFADSGFEEETAAIVDHFGVDNCRMLQMRREGCDFKNDSRGYFIVPGVETHDVLNPEGDPEGLWAAVQPLVADLLIVS